MRRLRPVLLLATVGACVALVSGTSTESAGSQPETPTFARDVAPILYRECASCHRPGEIAPMSLLSYDETRPWARAISRAVRNRTMPPWHADPAYHTFENARGLSDAEIETIARWVRTGAARGRVEDMPPTPAFTDGWSIGTPDDVFTMPEPHLVPAEGEVAYQYFQVPTDLAEDRWVRAIEIRPGAREVVHHVLVYEGPIEDADQDRSRRLRPLFRRITPDPSLDPETPDTDSPVPVRRLLATTAPGTNATTFRPGTALRLSAGAHLVFQVHYTANGEPTLDRTSVGVVYTDEPSREEIRAPAMLNPQLLVPAGAADHPVEATIEFVADTTMYGIFPHTHLRGKRWRYTLEYPDGRSDVVLSVPRYDFDWQTFYMYERPIAIPKGARLTAVAHYDNSRTNPANPDPSVDVRWGAQTWEEMHYTGFLMGDPIAPAATGQAQR